MVAFCIYYVVWLWVGAVSMDECLRSNPNKDQCYPKICAWSDVDGQPIYCKEGEHKP